MDLLAGPGKNIVRESGHVVLGSPLIALTTRHPFTHYFFGDLSPKNTSSLHTRCSVSPHSDRVEIATGDCNDMVDRVVARITENDWQSLNLAFLDPQGLELGWQVVAKLASVQRMDLIVNYPEMGLNRSMRSAVESDEESKVDAFFGDYGWRDTYMEWQRTGKRRGLHRQLVDFYRGRLQGLGYEEVKRVEHLGDEPLMRSVRKKAPLYRLLFASKHPLGHRFWQSITQRDVHGQRRLL